MNVLLVSQCSKRALQETRRVLDQFAERKGDRTWATVITLEGLETLRKLLRKNARRNTAVACHWLKTTGPELYWIVGNARRFNQQGTVPTNTTGRNILRREDENQWHTGEVIALLAAIAGLFHDFGKANQLFQQKLHNKRKILSEPLRHEWISLHLFLTFVAGRDAETWLTALSKITPDDEANLLNALQKISPQQKRAGNPLCQCHCELAKTVGWLILSHHRLPQFDPSNKKNACGEPELASLTLASIRVEPSWISPQCQDAQWTQQEWQQIWQFPYGTPVASQTWCNKANRLATRALQCHSLLQPTNWMEQRFTAHLARLSLMLADHAYSAGAVNEKWQDKQYRAFANTDRLTKCCKQALDEHNIGVGHNAYLLAKSLPQIRRHLPAITRHKGFKQRSQMAAFRWQDKAFDLAKSVASRSQQQGFFGVNMASTGCGKTFANARIMYALSDEKLGCRFSVALGLRTLTLQTGDALAERLSLNSDDLATLIGSSAVQQLHQLHTSEQQPTAATGSESAQSLLEHTLHVRYEGSLDDGPLRRWLSDPTGKKPRKRLHELVSAPVLVSTIDHLIPATEGTRGGRQIGPMLRLLTADLVLDEPDDFGLADLPALCRLVNWAGMLGSRVLLSSATLPPALINALFAAYQAGRKHYHHACGQPGPMPAIYCAWFDEFQSVIQPVTEAKAFKEISQQFVGQRLNELKKQPALRTGAILPVVTAGQQNHQVLAGMATAIHTAMLQLHQQHAESHSSGKRLSVGVIRIANINPLVAIAQQVLSQAAPADTRIHFCIYHSQHPLLVRSEMEKQLDSLLQRQSSDKIWQHPAVQQALQQPETNQLFVVFASPVAEVGRDHDYDWAIVEPSSVRSLIQLAGRVQRHRKKPPSSANVLILEKNFRALQGKTPAYCRPGFESAQFCLNNPSMVSSLPAACYQTISAAPAIQIPPGVSLKGSYDRLDMLEHAHLHVTLFGRVKPDQDRPPNTPAAQCWWQYPIDWSGEMQRQSRFRASAEQHCFVLYHQDEDEPLCWHQLTDDGQLGSAIAETYFQQPTFVPAERNQPWLNNQPAELLAALAQQIEWDADKLSRTFTELRLRKPPDNSDSIIWQYDPLFGVYQTLTMLSGGRDE
ncbi:type I-F CRISPR-associated helicase Cas3f [Serratia microhaemolytica]|uniref:type I-F CRISPR-associated helicase Cas3f n=1 Tax=Serratia microhaemolytica TaxID=2675110 RepID=UPI000FDDA344|nr:type I-F CRISPR-associated helicase Cas3f [Serratia microhaemolytica]